ncbi:MAG: hypothetical protein PHO63_02630 [Bacilli bacterium]|nr:hypothetical protein [Bacilli bacterium]MDD4809397.1 hypothetical protein [Bacilli bacterium]
MDELNYTREDLNKLKIFNKGGFEGRILIYNDHLLIKAFEPYLRGIIDFDNKKLKLIRLNQKQINGKILIHPHQLVNVDGQFEGYTMTKIDGGITIDNFTDFRVLVNLYQKLFQKIEILHQNNIIIGDVKHANIVVEDNNPVFIDVDSMAVDEFPMEHRDFCSNTTKSIPNISDKIKRNDETEIDKLKLLACFITSINKNKGNIMDKLMTSDLSDPFKKEIASVLKQDKSNISHNIHDLFDEETKKTSRR